VRREYGKWIAYGESKLANLTFALELARDSFACRHSCTIAAEWQEIKDGRARPDEAGDPSSDQLSIRRAASAAFMPIVTPLARAGSLPLGAISAKPAAGRPRRVSSAIRSIRPMRVVGIATFAFKPA
jgi:hypothetical protein